MSGLLATGRKVLFSWQFLLNVLVILIITCWIPLLTQTMEMRDSEGNLIQQVTKTSRAYESWWVVVRMAPGMKSHLRAVALHFGMCFFISFFVWFIRIYNLKESPLKIPSEGEKKEDENGEGCDSC
jgi:hypothetical protein